MKTKEGTKEKGTRKRKKSLKGDVKGGADGSVEAGSLTNEVDPIMATIDAVLANASAISTTFVKPRKMKKSKKQDQEGTMAKTPKLDADTTADDGGDDNDDDSSTAGM